MSDLHHGLNVGRPSNPKLPKNNNVAHFRILKIKSVVSIEADMTVLEISLTDISSVSLALKTKMNCLMYISHVI